MLDNLSGKRILRLACRSLATKLGYAWLAFDNEFGIPHGSYIARNVDHVGMHFRLGSRLD